MDPEEGLLNGLPPLPALPQGDEYVGDDDEDDDGAWCTRWMSSPRRRRSQKPRRRRGTMSQRREQSERLRPVKEEADENEKNRRQRVVTKRPASMSLNAMAMVAAGGEASGSVSLMQRKPLKTNKQVQLFVLPLGWGFVMFSFKRVAGECLCMHAPLRFRWHWVGEREVEE